jgi:hypothetical protein
MWAHSLLYLPQSSSRKETTRWLPSHALVPRSIEPVVSARTPRNARSGTEDLSRLPLEWLHHYLPQREHIPILIYTMLSDVANNRRTGFAEDHGYRNQFDSR